MNREEYWDDVKSTVRGMWSDYELESADSDAACNALSEAAASMTVYTSTCQSIMQHTDNEDAFTEIGLDGAGSWAEIVCRAASFAYEADLRDEALSWSEEDIFAEGEVFRCEDCTSVCPNDEGHVDPDQEDLIRCAACHQDWVEEEAERLAEEGEE